MSSTLVRLCSLEGLEATLIHPEAGILSPNELWDEGPLASCLVRAVGIPPRTRAAPRWLCSAPRLPRQPPPPPTVRILAACREEALRPPTRASHRRWELIASPPARWSAARRPAPARASRVSYPAVKFRTGSVENFMRVRMHTHFCLSRARMCTNTLPCARVRERARADSNT